MSNYTTSVYNLEQNNFDFGLNEYQVPNEEVRELVNKSILDYYRWYEIGFDNIAQFRERLNAKMNRIFSDRYCELFEKKLIEFNPLYNIEITETFEHTVDSETSVTDKGTSTGTDTSGGSDSVSSSSGSDSVGSVGTYPQESTVFADMGNSEFVDSVSKGKDTATSSSTTNYGATTNSIGTSESEQSGNGKTIENYTRKQEGSSAGLPFSKAMVQFRQYLNKFSLLEDICLELSDLFIQVW